MLEVIQCHTWGHIRMLDDCIYSLSVDTSSWLREALFWCFSLYLWYVKEKNKYSPLSLISYHCGSIFNSEEQFLVLDLSFSSNTKTPLHQAITIHLLHNNEELFTNVGFTLLLRNFNVTVLYRTCSFFKTPKVRKRFFLVNRLYYLECQWASVEIRLENLRILQINAGIDNTHSNWITRVNLHTLYSLLYPILWLMQGARGRREMYTLLSFTLRWQGHTHVPPAPLHHHRHTPLFRLSFRTQTH